MAFHEVTFPDSISYGSSMGPGFSTLITSLASGGEERVARWENPRRRFNLGFGAKTHLQVATLIKFATLRNGAECGFRLKDWTDYNTSEYGIGSEFGGAEPANDDQIIGEGDGSTVTFQLKKTYSDSVSPSKVRNITKPRDGTVVVAVGGVAQTEGVDYSVNYENGEILFGSAPASLASITAGCEFDVPVRFTKSVDKWLSVAIRNYNDAAAESLEAVEILDSTEIPTEFWYGGANTFDFATDTALTILSGRVKVATATTTGKKLVLPTTTSLPAGGPYFYIAGGSGTDDYDIVTNDFGTTIATVTDGDIVELLLDDSGNWLAR